MRLPDTMSQEDREPLLRAAYKILVVEQNANLVTWLPVLIERNTFKEGALSMFMVPVEVATIKMLDGR